MHNPQVQYISLCETTAEQLKSHFIHVRTMHARSTHLASIDFYLYLPRILEGLYDSKKLQ